jgi:hypothetical protein
MRISGIDFNVSTVSSSASIVNLISDSFVTIDGEIRSRFLLNNASIRSLASVGVNNVGDNDGFFGDNNVELDTWRRQRCTITCQ